MTDGRMPPPSAGFRGRTCAPGSPLSSFFRSVVKATRFLQDQEQTRGMEGQWVLLGRLSQSHTYANSMLGASPLRRQARHVKDVSGQCQNLPHTGFGAFGKCTKSPRWLLQFHLRKSTHHTRTCHPSWALSSTATTPYLKRPVINRSSR